MYLEFSKKAAQDLDLVLEDIDTGLNEDVWLMIPFTYDRPEEGEYVLYYHPYSNLFFVDKPEPDWKRNVPHAVKYAFEKYFDHLGTGDLFVKQHFLVPLRDLRFVPVSPALKDAKKSAKKWIKRLKKHYKKLSKKERKFFTGEYDFFWLYDTYNFTKVEEGEAFPNRAQLLDGTTSLFYPSDYDFIYPFADSKKALAPPPTDSDLKEESAWKNFQLKAPLKKNFKKLKALDKKEKKLRRKPENKKRLEKIRKIQDKKWSFMEIPFSEFDLFLFFADRGVDFDEKALLIKINLDLGDKVVYRRIVVDGDMTFTDFEILLNRLFRWKGFPHHMGSFLFSPADDKRSHEIEEMLVHTDEEIPDDLKRREVDGLDRRWPGTFPEAKKMDIRDYKLKDFFPRHLSAYYRYDNLNNWVHTLEIMDVYDKNSITHPLPFLEISAGVAPPEDVDRDDFKHVLRHDTDGIEPSAFRKTAKKWMDEQHMFIQGPTDLSPLFEERD